TRCGRCCVAGGDYYVFMNTAEAEAIRSYLQLSHQWFQRRYLGRLEEGELVATSGSGGRCVFLDSEGQCRIYPVRPLQCRSYPFWPELVRSKTAWQREARRCEGINRGKAVATGRIRKFYNACRAEGD
ncbi:MAG: YkgJ family cysteine cluster protein, partial [Gammaproteobacteria bacterium]|nr:YkgJ family cysteine cluster protein [Gammaproteobacteria bacterium]